MESLDVLAAKPPALSRSDAERIAAQVFGVAAAARALPSERDQNFHLRADDGRELVLKVANPAEDPGVRDLQVRALLHVAARDPSLPVPRVLATPAGELSPSVEAPDGRRHRVQLLTFVRGTPLGESPRGAGLLRDLGATLARLGRALRGFFHPAAGRELLWDLKHAARLREHLVHVEDPQRRRLADRRLERFERRVLPVLPDLRAQPIHNDVSRDNALVDPSGERVVGIVDFGDMVHAPLVNDVAVTVAEAIQGAPDPAGAALELVGGYQAVEPLREEELALLVDLVAARLVAAIAIAAWRVKRFPENREYIAGDQGLLFEALESLAELEPVLRGAAVVEGRGPAVPRPARPEPIRSAGEPVAVRPAGSARRAVGRSDRDLEPIRSAVERSEQDLELLARRARVLGPALSHLYDRPLHLVRGRGAWLFDASGRAYLDAYNNVPHVGHCHPAVVEAIARQAARLNTNTRYLYGSILDYAERLTATLPHPLRVCIFVNSGSEANDLAWRLAKAHTGNAGALVVEGAYHGTTDATSDLSAGELGPGEELARHVRAVPAPDGYRGPHRRGEPHLGPRYAEYADGAIESLRESGLAPAAFFVDPLLSSSGIVEAPPGWLRAVFAKVRAAGGLCVADEVQAGFGRTGEHMWGFEAHGVLPDVVTLGKPIGNGHPLAAVVTTAEIARSLARGGGFFSTFGGNPVSCAAGLAVLEVMEREGLRENARRVGARLRAGLEVLAATCPLVGDVRGAGLYLGVELVRDRATLEPAAGETHAVVNRMREDGVLVGIEGPRRNVVKIRPPMVFAEADADRLLDVFGAALRRSP
jgi:4-aminobutyrate aminotransferase-like enzyme/Ser/Thr protein kinase RdoA (MazF antagonist)